MTALTHSVTVALQLQALLPVQYSKPAIPKPAREPQYVLMTWCRRGCLSGLGKRPHCSLPASWGQSADLCGHQCSLQYHICQEGSGVQDHGPGNSGNLSRAHLCRHSRRLQHDQHHKDHKGHHKEHKHHQHDKKAYRYENSSIPDSVNWPEQGIVSPIKNQHVNGSKVRHIQGEGAIEGDSESIGGLLRVCWAQTQLTQHAQQARLLMSEISSKVNS